MFSEQDIFEICLNRVNIETLNGDNHTLCLDGTSCTHKSSILEYASKITNCPVTKVQRLYNAININTYAPSLIGYICSGMLSLYNGDAVGHFNDRSPLNPLDWSILWKIMDHYVRNHGNVYPDERNQSIVESLKLYVQIIETYKRTYYYQMFASKINCIAIIDSNTHRCDEIRLRRNESSDLERSSWRFYTYLQNLLYKTLYSEAIIDLAWFDNYDITTDDIICGISKYCKYILGILVERNKRSYPIIQSYKLPTPVSEDLTFKNLNTHVYRSIGRCGCKMIAAKHLTRKRKAGAAVAADYKINKSNIDVCGVDSFCCEINDSNYDVDYDVDVDVDVDVDDDDANTILLNYMPSILNVENIKLPNVNQLNINSIHSKNISYLFKSPISPDYDDDDASANGSCNIFDDGFDEVDCIKDEDFDDIN